MRRWLIDAGPLVAYVDASDPAHAAVVRALDEFRGHLYTTTAVVTEAMHLVADDPEGPAVLVEFLIATGTTVADVGSRGELQAAVRLMRKYQDTPMDFADATLVLLSDRLAVTDILTLDRRGFTTYRTAKGRGFRVWPSP